MRGNAMVHSLTMALKMNHAIIYYHYILLSKANSLVSASVALAAASTSLRFSELTRMASVQKVWLSASRMPLQAIPSAIQKISLMNNAPSQKLMSYRTTRGWPTERMGTLPLSLEAIRHLYSAKVKMPYLYLLSKWRVSRVLSTGKFRMKQAPWCYQTRSKPWNKVNASLSGTLARFTTNDTRRPLTGQHKKLRLWWRTESMRNCIMNNLRWP